MNKREHPVLTFRLRLVLLLIVLISTFCCKIDTVYAEDEISALELLDEQNRFIDQAEKRFTKHPNNTTILQEISSTSLAAKRFAESCLVSKEKELAETIDAMDSLGVAQPNDNLDGPRKKLEKQKFDSEKYLAQCRLLNLRASELQKKLQEQEQNQLKARLFSKENSIFGYLSEALNSPNLLAKEFNQLSNEFYQQSKQANWSNLYLALAYGIAGMFVGLIWSHQKKQQYHKQAPSIIKTSPSLATFINSSIRVSPALLMVGLINLSFYFYPPQIPALQQLALPLLVFTVSYAILRAMLRPPKQLVGFTPLLPSTSKRLFFWSRILFFTSLLGALLDTVVFRTEADTSGTLTGLLRIVIITLVGLALIALLWVLRNYLNALRKFKLHWIIMIATTAAIIALWSGYFNFSVYMLRGIMGSIFLLLLGWILFRIPVEIFDTLDDGNAPWQKRLRKRMGLEAGQIVPGLIWLRLAHALLVYGGISIIMLRLWGMSEPAFDRMIERIINGYELGAYTLEPLKILYGLVLIALLFSLTQLVKRSLDKNWLKRTNLSRGAREATITITGYIGMAFAIFIGLSVAGINFTNIALIAGALSVGIGFGLQNIVNNFISGIILLFERPIRRGDWIRVGQAEGYVKDISIRSTTIQTFDRSDIIVPNSELIANQVTNMMLNDQAGRVILPLRIPYEADTEKVMDIIRRTAELHPGVLREHGKLQIQVILRSFAETAKLIELRCHIRDVENMNVIISELNIAVEKAFIKEGIKFPLPQQLVYVQQQ